MQMHLKRAFDVVFAGLVLIMFSPVMAAVAIAILLRLGRPIIFRQLRPGYRGRAIVVYKFRTMSNVQERDNRPLTDDERTDALGRLLRRLSLDELPQVWNVVKGEMSVVGPRPLLMEYLPHYSAEQMRRHDMKPGITGLAQVSGRNAVPWSRRFELDVWYVDHWSLWLDAKILAATVMRVLSGEGVNVAGLTTFRGDVGPTG